MWLVREGGAGAGEGIGGGGESRGRAGLSWTTLMVGWSVSRAIGHFVVDAQEGLVPMLNEFKKEVPEV